MHGASLATDGFHRSLDCYQKASQEAFKVVHDMAGSPEPGAGAAPALAVAPVP